MFKSRKREVYRNLKHDYIDKFETRESENLSLDDLWVALARANSPRCKCPCGDEGKKDTELWLVRLHRVDFAKKFPNSSEAVREERSLLTMRDPLNASTEYLAKHGLPDPKEKRYRLFQILLNTKFCPNERKGKNFDVWMVDLEEQLIGLAHEINYLEDHFTLRQIYDRKTYNNLDKEQFRFPISERDSNLLCSISTVARLLKGVETNLGPRFLFTTEEEFNHWLSVDKANRKGFENLNSLLKKKRISWRSFQRELEPLFNLAPKREIPRDSTQHISLEIVDEIEAAIWGSGE